MEQINDLKELFSELSIGIFTGIIVVYFLPSLIALLRMKANFFAILILNIFLGWTFIGWVVALVWSFTTNRKSIIINNSNSSQEKLGEVSNKKTSPILTIVVLFIFSVGAISVYYLNSESKENEIINSRPNYEYENIDELFTAFGFYTVKKSESNRAYFHNEPKPETKRRSYITTEDNFVIIKIKNGFALVEFENSKGQITKGWLNMKDINECLDCE